MTNKMPRIDARKICLIRLSALGDVVHALGLINGIRRGYPDAHITWILQPVPYDMVKLQPGVDRFEIVDKKRGWRAIRDLRTRLKNDRFDLLLVPQVSFRASLVAAAVNAPVKLGYDLARARELHWLFTNRRLRRRPLAHAQDMMFEFLDYLEIPNEHPEWNFMFSEEEDTWRQEFIRPFDRPIVSFVISTSNPAKNWHAEGFASVMDGVADMGCQAVVIGGSSPRENALAKHIISLCKTQPVVALEQPIRHTMLQISCSRVVVSLDTGPLHVAVAMGIPTVGIYGYSNPRRCGPYRKYQELLVDAYSDSGEDNVPVSRKTKRGRMVGITPSRVLEKIQRALKAYPA
jgi:heptosyltransferase I